MATLGGSHVSARIGTSGIARWLLKPATAFLLVSLPFGIATLAIDPPLRGYDEKAHFIRVYGISVGDVVPTTRDDEGRRGTFIPDRLNTELRLFDDARINLDTPDFSYREVFEKYRRLLAERRNRQQPEHDVFVLYEGAEAYSPLPYLPQIVAAWIGRAFDADFLTLFTLMRVAAFLVATAVTAYAIAIVPYLQWGFLAIAMTPSAFYARTLVGVDGTVLSFSLVVAALALRRACECPPDALWVRSLCMTLCVASKPPQVVWISLEAMARPLRALARDWRGLALVTLPGLAVTMAWLLATSGDVGVWRISMGSHVPIELFGVKQQLLLALSDPLRFPRLLVATLSDGEIAELWRQLIGVLGWLDTDLESWVYPSIGALLIGSFFAPLPLDHATRRRIAAICLSSAIVYFLGVYLIFYLAWTPTNAPNIPGVQGRYFVVLLTPVAVGTAALVNRGPTEIFRAAIALLLAAISTYATIDAILQANW